MRAEEQPWRALLLLDHRRNREVLEQWLEREGSFETTVDPTDTQADLVVVDAAAFTTARDEIRRLADHAAPAHLPVLMVVSERQALRLPGGDVVKPRRDGHSQSVELIGARKTKPKSGGM